MKKLLLTLCIWICATLSFAQVPTAPEELQVYDSQTNIYTPLRVDPALDSLEGKEPLENTEDQSFVAASQPVIAGGIINGENWFQVDGRKPKYSPVVYLLDSRGSHCSGAMVGRAVLLTAAHCVYKDQPYNSAQKSPSELTAYAGGKNSSIRAKGKNIYVLEGATNRSSWMQFDYALIVLDKPIGDQSGYFGMRTVDFRQGDSIEIRSFPGRKDATSPWVSRGKVVGVQSGTITHDADILPGSSGAPVFMDDTGIAAVTSATGKGDFNIAVTSVDHRLISFVKQYRGYR